MFPPQEITADRTGLGQTQNSAIFPCPFPSFFSPPCCCKQPTCHFGLRLPDSVSVSWEVDDKVPVRWTKILLSKNPSLLHFTLGKYGKIRTLRAWQVNFNAILHWGRGKLIPWEAWVCQVWYIPAINFVSLQPETGKAIFVSHFVFFLEGGGRGRGIGSIQSWGFIKMRVLWGHLTWNC